MNNSSVIQKMIEFYHGSIHDIVCPLCREKYGNTNGIYQEKEGGPLARHISLLQSIYQLGT